MDDVLLKETGLIWENGGQRQFWHTPPLIFWVDYGMAQLQGNAASPNLRALDSGHIGCC